ncbi:sporulation initiation inhibitor [Candidatus Phycorickettsia trachydisci]|uniref:Sporulation initiation inhibitor n=1 Tax=Candidatus Phycorickettsia trachydisci TaxID=2115978 RepID=A0A2P1P9I4_9RICK|nr:AAA family ATPase [Candidatus Phycorickettsia trachydisci]AVP87932.1 sporulation initiation inhibitor [Candidatus Phycorickettsia trachydisci]
MIEQDKDGLNQRTMAVLSNVSPTTISRYITAHNLRPFDKSGSKNQKFSIETSREIIRNVTSIDGQKILKKKFVFYNFKGGVGKTSLCFQVSSHIALMGYNVLVIDADPQSHLSTSFGFSHYDNYLTLYDILTDGASFDDVKKTIFKGYDCIPSNLSLTRLEDDLAKLENKSQRLSSYFADIEKKYDFIFVDTNPTISLLNRNVVMFSDVINVVCETQPYSLNGLKLLLEDLEKFFVHMKTQPKELSIIPNKYEDRASSSAEAMTALRDFYSEYIKKDFAIRKSEDINISAKLGKPLALFAKKNSIALEDVVELIHYYLNQYTLTKTND